MAEHAAGNRATAARPAEAGAAERGPAASGLAARLGARPAMVAQRAIAARLNARANRTGLPDALKNGVERLSGIGMDDVRVHYGSARPAQMRAHAFAQGSDIHLAPGQERHLPHEAWHVVQQKQGRVAATGRIGGVALNDDAGLERESDAMGARAATTGAAGEATVQAVRIAGAGAMPVQLVKILLDGKEQDIEDLDEVALLRVRNAEIQRLVDAQPLATAATFAAVALWIDKCTLSSVLQRNLRGRLRIWQRGGGEDGRRPARPRRRKRTVGDKRSRKVFEDSESDLSEPETDPDRWAERKPIGLTSAMNRTHNPTAEDKEKNPELHVTGLHHADTYMVVKQGGQFVPRTINDAPNKRARRKRLPEGMLNHLSAVRDDDSRPDDEREAAAEELIAIHKQLIFGNAIDWADGEYDDALVEAHESHRAELRDEETATGDLMRRNAVRGMRSGTKNVTEKDAEQRLLASVVWRGMTDRLREEMKRIVDDPVYLGTLSNFGIQLILNRSSCLGCGKALALALIDFWETVAEALKLASWREARDQYASLDLFRIAFPVLYEYGDEAKLKFRSFKVILDGLRDTGWTVQAPKGIESNAHAEQNHQALKKLLGGDKARKPVSTTTVNGDPRAVVQQDFELGLASGRSNNCLLNTIDQLQHNVRVPDAGRVRTMRETLNDAGLAIGDDMINLYGGAGMQLANDLHIRIQVIQIIGGTILSHPTLGTGGPLHYILHEGLHFTPLWRRAPVVVPEEAAAEEEEEAESSGDASSSQSGSDEDEV